MEEKKKESPVEADIRRLKSKIADRSTKGGIASGDAALRSLRKRLKRGQRKKRVLLSRLAHAQAKKRETKPAAG